jgi:tetratricopeptide (TPR) repeat protein
MNNFNRTNLIIGISIAVVTFLTFLPSLQNGFINWDDTEYVYENPFIRFLDAHLLKSAFTGFYAGNWHPLTWLSHAFDYAIWGLNPFGHHLTNNILHVLVTLIVVFLVMRLLEVRRKISQNSGPSKPFLHDRTIRIAGAATGLLFGLHPIHVESVAWIAERKDLLCAAFFLLAICTYIKYVSRITTSVSLKTTSGLFDKEYIYTFGLFTFSLLSKPMAVTLPFVLLLLDWYPFRRIRSIKTFWAAAIEKLPFFILSLVSSMLTILAQKTGGAIRTLPEIPVVTRLMVAAKSLIAYLGKILLPVNLVPFYPYPKNVSLLSLEFSIPLIIAIAITIACMIVRQNHKLWISAWGYYVITLIPVLGIIQVGEQSMADRYTYLPSLGPIFLVGLSTAEVYKKLLEPNRWRRTWRISGLFIIMIVLLSMSYATVRQLGVWKDSVVFWNYVIDKEPSQLSFAHNNLGTVYQAKGLYDMAIEQYQAALKIRTDQADIYYNLGIAYQSKGLNDMAIEQYEAALRLKPDYIEAYYNIGVICQSQGQYGLAIEQYQAALRLKPDFAEAYNNLGNAYQSKGLNDTAIEQYQIALKLRPDFAEAHFNLGWSYLKKGYKDMARREYELGLMIKPGDYNARRVFNSILIE